MATKIKLFIRFEINPGRIAEARNLVQGIMSQYEHEPAFVMGVEHSLLERHDEASLYEIWHGTAKQFQKKQGVKPYRPKFVEDIKLLANKVTVEV